MAKSKYSTSADVGLPNYRRYCGMRRRCLDRASPVFSDYGGRGIRICQRWLDAFRNFDDDMGNPPSPAHSLDRVDNNAHYSCGKCDECAANGWQFNCRWATPVEQSNNTRRNVLLTLDGETLTIRQWARRLGISDNTLYMRRSRGETEPTKILKRTPKRRKSIIKHW